MLPTLSLALVSAQEVDRRRADVWVKYIRLQQLCIQYLLHRQNATMRFVIGMFAHFGEGSSPVAKLASLPLQAKAHVAPPQGKETSSPLKFKTVHSSVVGGWWLRPAAPGRFPANQHPCLSPCRQTAHCYIG